MARGKTTGREGARTFTIEIGRWDVMGRFIGVVDSTPFKAGFLQDYMARLQAAGCSRADGGFRWERRVGGWVYGSRGGGEMGEAV